MRQNRMPPAAVRPRPEQLEARDLPSVLWVDDDRAQKKNADFTSIEAAVQAAHPGDKIMVAPGVYTEQVTIDKDNLTVQSQRPLAAKIVAPPALDSTGAAVHVTAHGVDLEGFTITGPSPTLAIGVLLDAGSSATVRQNLITDIKPDAALGGTQTGWGVWIGGLTAGGATAEVTDNTITDYQKGGVVAFDPASFVTIARNTITGAGPNAVIAQNGIELDDGVNGTVTQNTVSGNVYTPAGTEATGILVFDAGRLEVSHNSVTANELGVAAVSQTAPLTVSHNDTVNNTLDGIYLEGVTGATVSQNRSTGNGRSGVYVTGQSSAITITGNDLRGNAGPDAHDDTVGTGTAGTANFWDHNRFDDTDRPGLR